jgi:DNA polymerase III delta prime subunit
MSNVWGIAVMPTPTQITLEQALLNWDNSKKFLEQAKEAEMQARKVAFDLGFGANAKEGTNTIELANDYKLKGVKKLNYKLKAPAGFQGDTIDAVDNCAEAFKRISNEGEFVSERLFKYSVTMSVEEYRKIADEAAYSETKKAMLTELNKILEITEAAPTLTIVEPKAKK